MRIYVKPFLHPIFKGTYETLSKIAEVNKINFSFSKPAVYEKQKFRKYVIFFLNNISIFPKALYYREAKNFDLIYSPQSIVPLNNKKYIVEIELLEMYLRKNEKLRHTKVVKYLAKKLLFRKNLVKILTYSEATRKAILWYFRDVPNISKKVETSYPVIEENYKKYKKQKNDVPCIGYACSGNKFYFKGGKIVIDTVCELSKKYDFKFIAKANVPKVMIKKLEKYNVNYEIINQVENMFKEFYSKIDIFLYPSVFDTFGYVLLEAKSMGIPIVACDYFSTREVVGKGGIVMGSCFKELIFDKHMLVRYGPLFHRPVLSLMFRGYKELVNDLSNAVSLLLEDEKIYKTCVKENINDVKNGKFSYKEKERQLKSIIYGE